MDKEQLTEYIKWLMSGLDDAENIEKKAVKTMLLSIIGEMYSQP